MLAESILEQLGQRAVLFGVNLVRHARGVALEPVFVHCLFHGWELSKLSRAWVSGVVLGRGDRVFRMTNRAAAHAQRMTAKYGPS